MVVITVVEWGTVVDTEDKETKIYKIELFKGSI